MKSNKILSWSITVALAGFLFGFDTIVISGADKPIQALWGTSDWYHSTFIMAMALWGTVIGALFGGIPCHRLGRKKTLFWIGVLYLVSALGSGLAPDEYFFSFFRFIGGLGVGASSVAAPIYISEIAPADKRGRLVAMYQFNIVFGILVAYLSNYFLGNTLGENAWRWMLGIEAFPAAIYSVMVLGIPESPRWLVQRNDVEGASAILKRINPLADIKAQIKIIQDSLTVKTAGIKTFYSGKYNKPITLAFLIAFFNQLSGINFVLYYAPRIFESMGIDPDNVLAASVPIGVVNLVFTLLGMYLIDRLGRKQLMIFGSIGYITFLLAVAWASFTGGTGGLVIFFICGFIASHAIGQGAVIWVFISEIFPNSVRDNGMSFGSGTHWVFAATITMVTLPIMAALKGNEWVIYCFFAGMMVLQLLFVIFMMPETKGVPLEELQKKLTGETDN
ncbi:MAG: sugar porter family MFS transporter [Saprospiraceae bacterium]|nr:sugar porter family MFS transporter [Saprospiraceae bacterium]